MSINRIFLTAIFATILLSVHGYAQCSDAGVCAIGHAPTADKKQYSVDIRYRYGNSGKEDKIAYNSFELKAAVSVYQQTSLLLSFPFYRFNTGANGDANGIGDLMAFINQDFDAFSNARLSVLLGMRLATGNTNANPDLPQAYQPGLGTTDIIFGLKYTGESFLLSAGYQLVENVFTKNELTPIRRGDDLYLQFAYLFETGDFDIKADAQMIQRLAKTMLKNQDGTINELDKTDQMQINIGAEVNYRLDGTNNLVSGFAMPILKRETNIDGLTRVLTFFAGWRLQL